LPPPKKSKLEPLTSKSPEPEIIKTGVGLKLDPISAEIEKKSVADMESKLKSIEKTNM
jgi:hypothetical protein